MPRNTRSRACAKECIKSVHTVETIELLRALMYRFETPGIVSHVSKRYESALPFLASCLGRSTTNHVDLVRSYRFDTLRKFRYISFLIEDSELSSRLSFIIKLKNQIQNWPLSPLRDSIFLQSWKRRLNNIPTHPPKVHFIKNTNKEIAFNPPPIPFICQYKFPYNLEGK